MRLQQQQGTAGPRGYLVRQAVGGDGVGREEGGACRRVSAIHTAGYSVLSTKIVKSGLQSYEKICL